MRRKVGVISCGKDFTRFLSVLIICCCTIPAGCAADARSTGGDGAHVADVLGTCASGSVADAGGTCVKSHSEPIVPGAKREAFWAEIRRRGLLLKLKRTIVAEKAQAGRPARNRTAMVLSDDVFYGRATMKIPRYALLSLETAPNVDLRRECTDFLFEKKVLEKRFNISSEDTLHLLSLAFPLVAERRDPESVFRDWLDAVSNERVFVLELTERQLSVLKGTTVEQAYDEMAGKVNTIRTTSGNISYFKKIPMTLEEASWALAVLMRHSRVVHPHQDVRETRKSRMYIFPLVELLDIQLSPDVSQASAFQEEITLEDGKREEEMVVHFARRDMPKGEELFLWPGRLSNSEMIVRHGFAFPYNPIGVGRNVTEPPNWGDPKAMRVYSKYNCSDITDFELRISKSGKPMQSFARCYRLSWFMLNGWYNPGLERRMRDFNTWPPPKTYKKTDWLAWTQADADLNKRIKDHCIERREALRDTMEAAVVKDFRDSKDPIDKILWHLRAEESTTFKECITLADKISAQS